MLFEANQPSPDYPLFIADIRGFLLSFTDLYFSQMPATLYQPGTAPLAISDEGLWTPGRTPEFGGFEDLVPALLHCHPRLVDVQANGPGYMVYTVFDCEGEINPAAMKAVGELVGLTFNIEDEDEVLRGPVLVVLAGDK
ncbi:hypothetical protein [Hymenobacter edaphi]|uniref:hypothetical protein n=1 Tax=Hymenobacter edaphi TaxID=2211146 RepID=UPI00140399A8|nr:hypothetical protein [Hymenobacter edaphi]